MARKFLTSLDMSGNQIVSARFENLAGFPSAGSAGRVVYDTSGSVLGYDNGSAFVTLASLASPAFSGTPTAPTASGGTNTTQVATTAFVADAISGLGSGSGDMLQSVYDTNSNGTVDAAEAVPYAGITGLPATFPPNAHTHTASEITDFSTEVDNSIIAYFDTVAASDANVDTLRELLDVVLANEAALTGLIGRFEADFGDGSATSYAITHNLASLDVTVEVYETATGATVGCDVVRTNTNVVTLGVEPAPASNALRVVIKR